jgi:hypothetical protein
MHRSRCLARSAICLLSVKLCDILYETLCPLDYFLAFPRFGITLRSGTGQPATRSEVTALVP